MITSGFHSLDKIIGGFKGANLYVIAVGAPIQNSVIGCNLAFRLSIEKHHRMLFFSLSRTNVQTITALISIKSGISANNVKNGKLDNTQWKTLETSIPPLADSPLLLDDTIPFKIDDVCAKFRNTQCDIIVIDGFSIENGKEKTEIIQRLKALSIELQIPVVIITEHTHKSRVGNTQILQWKKSTLECVDCLMFAEPPLKGSLLSIMNITDWAIHSLVCMPANAYNIYVAKHGVYDYKEAILKIDFASGKLSDF